MKKSILVVLTLTLTLGLLTGCGAKETSTTAENINNKNTKTIIVGASPNPHSEILNFAKEKLKDKGINVEVKEFTDYVIPNKALNDKELDCNYFQHEPYLIDFNEKNNTKLISVGKIHGEPLGAYSNKIKSLENIKDKAVIAIPNDSSNGSRALKLLEKQNLIKLKDNTAAIQTEKDITENNKNLEIKFVEAVQLPRLLDEVDIAIINGNYALASNLDTNSVIFSEDINDIDKYVNIIATRDDNKDDENIKALVEFLKSDETKKFINEKYGKAILPAK